MTGSAARARTPAYRRDRSPGGRSAQNTRKSSSGSMRPQPFGHARSAGTGPRLRACGADHDELSAAWRPPGKRSSPTVGQAAHLS
jgi:hypothetical protein